MAKTNAKTPHFRRNENHTYYVKYKVLTLTNTQQVLTIEPLFTIFTLI